MPKTKAPRLDEVQIDGEYGYKSSSYGSAADALLVRAVSIENTLNGRRVKVALLEARTGHTSMAVGDEIFVEAKHLRYTPDEVRERRMALALAEAARTKLKAALRLRGLDDDVAGHSHRDTESITLRLDPAQAVALAEALIEPVDPA